MPLITPEYFRNTFVKGAGEDAKRDAWLETTIAAVSAEFARVCNQPLETTTGVIDLFYGHGLAWRVLPYTLATAVTALAYRDDPMESFTTIATSEYTTSLTGTVKRIYLEDSFSKTSEYRLTLTTGFVTIPDDLQHLCGTRVLELWKESDFGDNRFGKSSIATSYEGKTTTVTFKPMAETIRKGLERFRRRVV